MPKDNAWFWDGPVVPIRISSGAKSAPGHVINASYGGIGVRLDAPAPSYLQRGDLVLIEFELNERGGCVTVSGTLRQRGTGCHDGFLSLTLSEDFAPSSCSQAGIATALESLGYSVEPSRSE